MKESVCLISLGCPKNLVDAEVTLGLLSKEGYTLVTDPSKAEILIINTCSFIQDAVREALDTILQYSQYKKEGRCRLLVVSGCLPQRYGERLEEQLPEVDLFVGTGTFHRLPELLSRKRDEKSFISGPSYLYDETSPRILATPSFTAYLKIAEGCSKNCTFCTVPSIRGPYRSRTIPSIVTEAEKLTDQGVREIILIGQDTTAYGEDLGDGSNLEKLLRAVVKVEKLRWIRFLYAYPREKYFTSGLLRLMAGEKRICSYLDLPIQHIDDGILRRMARRTTGREIRNLLKRVKESLPHAILRTSLIVGFPGEGEKEFNALMDFVEETRFDNLGAFKYSPEEGTPAAKLSGSVPEEVKEERLGVLMERQKGISLEKHRSMVGKRIDVLVEGSDSGKGMLKGRFSGQAPEIDGCVFLKGKAQPGDWVEARVTNALPYDLVGKIEKVLS
jgi:ribosomal protein S12 methylthiotransferase